MNYNTRDRYCEYLKIRLPHSPEDFNNGSGEEVWILITPETREDIDANNYYSLYSGILDSDSQSYPSLKSGSKILFIVDDEKYPCATLDFLNKYRIDSTEYNSTEKV